VESWLKLMTVPFPGAHSAFSTFSALWHHAYIAPCSPTQTSVLSFVGPPGPYCRCMSMLSAHNMSVALAIRILITSLINNGIWSGKCPACKGCPIHRPIKRQQLITDLLAARSWGLERPVYDRLYVHALSRRFLHSG